MKLSTITHWLAAAVAAAALAACGGGGGASGGIDGTGGGNNNGGGGVGGITGGIDGTGVSYGTITAFGSVWVNGVEFSTSTSKYSFDDRSGISQSDLRVGMVVRVDGSIDDKKANLIIVDDSIKGQVQSVSADGSSMVVMGQTVRFDDKTTFEGGVRPRQNDHVEVHGLPGAGGVVAAGFVQKTTGTPLYEVKGLAANHDTAAKTFTIGTLTVNYGSATVDNSLPTGSWNGVAIEAKGTNCAGAPACTTLTATKVERSGLKLSSSVSVAKAEVEGLVVSGDSTSFVIGGQTVVTTASTVFERGVAADVIPGTKLEAEGSIANGVLTAVKVSFRDSYRFEADVATVDAAAGTVTLVGLPGVTVKVDSATRLKGKVTSLAAYNTSTHLKIKARPSAGTAVIALEIDADDKADNRVEIRGPVQSINGTTSLTILGLSVDNGSASEFRDLSDALLSRASFYAAVKVGTLVQARGDLSGGSVGWKQMELED
jgi:Domain of unknown function (DUF5666)